MADATATSREQSSKSAQETSKFDTTNANPPEPSNAEKKRQQKAEKQARRAKEKADIQQPSNITKPEEPSQKIEKDSTKPPNGAKSDTSGSGRPSEQHHTKLPIRQRRQSQGGSKEPQTSADRQTQSPAAKAQKRSNQVSCFAHLYGQQPQRNTLEETSKDVHPAVQELALRIGSYVICGSHARCVAMLQAFKAVIRDYSTPPGRSLPRDLPTHTLSPQIAHIKSHGRPLSTSQSSAIRWLKNAIATLDPSMPDRAAKTHLCQLIDDFIRERLTFADKIIAEKAAGLINDVKEQEDGVPIGEEETVLVYGCSAVVTDAIATAVLNEKKRFRVIVVDSRPRHEGRAMAKSLASLVTQNPIRHTNSQSQAQQAPETNSTTPKPKRQGGITQLDLLPLGPSLTTAAKQATLVFLGAHSVFANGSVYARAGTASVALTCKELGGNTNFPSPHEPRIPNTGTGPTTSSHIPASVNYLTPKPRVIILAETLKFTERVALDSIVMNELAPPEELQFEQHRRGDENSQEDTLSSAKKNWNDDVLYLNPMYDVTPAELVDAMITELGFIGPGAGGVEGILRLKEREEEADAGASRE
ncbi:MAG: hypothetical protein M1831_006283 [Alyxoria varia]|nr:MAG: hypothetical protein M1831_006283 [Alyxoria varia]